MKINKPHYYQVYSAYGTLFGKFGKQIYSQNKVVALYYIYIKKNNNKFKHLY